MQKYKRTHVVLPEFVETPSTPPPPEKKENTEIDFSSENNKTEVRESTYYQIIRMCIAFIIYLLSSNN